MKIVALTLNPALDVHCTTPTFRAERENKAVITDTQAGGKGVNIVRALASADISATTIVAVGRENGQSFLDRLTRDGVKYKALFLPGKVRENITIHPETGRETRLSFAGSHADARLLSRVARTLEKDVSDQLMLTVTGSNPPGVSAADVLAFLAPLRARGVRVVIDSGAFTVADLVAAKPYLIKPNEEEIAAYLGKEATTDADVLAFARQMHANGVENAMVTLGGRGAYLVCGEGAFFAAAPSVTPVSTIGAGDSSIAGFLAAAAAGADAPARLARAVAFGSAACLTRGTEPPRKREIARLLRAVSVTRL